MKNFKELRKALNITRKDLAEEFEIPYRTFENWEQGVNNPSNFTKTQLYASLFDELESRVCDKTWGEIDESIKTWLKSEVVCYDGVTCEEVREGECIVDLKPFGDDFLSVPGSIVNSEIIIEDDAIVYKAY